MGMEYMIGYNPSHPKGKQWTEISVNSTSDMYLLRVWGSTIARKYPALYDKISEEVMFMRFDELTQNQFMTVVNEVRQLKNRNDLLEGDKIGLEIWGELFEPLIVIDERYDAKLVGELYTEKQGNIDSQQE